MKTIKILLSIVISLFVINGVVLAQEKLGLFSDPFISIQLADSPSADYILSTDGTDNSWIDSTGLGLPFAWTDTSYGVSTTSVVAFLNGSMSMTSTTIIGTLRHDGNATTTGIIYLENYTSCAGLGNDGKLTVDANGLVVCAADISTAGSAGSNWLFGADQTFISPSTTVGIIVLASSTIPSLVVSDSITLYADAIIDSEVVDALTINTSIEGIFTGNLRSNLINATSTLTDHATTTGAHYATGGFIGDLIGDVVGNLTGAVTGNADTATDLASNPNDCAANQFAHEIDTKGNLACLAIADADLTAITALTNITFNAVTTTDTLVVGGYLNVTGQITGNVTGDLTGNADTATALTDFGGDWLTVENASSTTFSTTDNSSYWTANFDSSWLTAENASTTTFSTTDNTTYWSTTFASSWLTAENASSTTFSTTDNTSYWTANFDSSWLTAENASSTTFSTLDNSSYWTTNFTTQWDIYTSASSTILTENDFTGEFAAESSTNLSDTADLLYETELDAFSELQTQIGDKTLVNEEDAWTFDDAITITGLLTGNGGGIFSSATSSDTFYATTFIGALQGNADTATALTDFGGDWLTTENASSTTFSTVDNATYWGANFQSEWDDKANASSTNITLNDIDTSAKVAGIVSDETGTGLMCFATLPQFTTGIDILGYSSSTSITVNDRFSVDANGNATTTGSSTVFGTASSSDIMVGSSMIKFGNGMCIGEDTATTTPNITIQSCGDF